MQSLDVERQSERIPRLWDRFVGVITSRSQRFERLPEDEADFTNAGAAQTSETIRRHVLWTCIRHGRQTQGIQDAWHELELIQCEYGTRAMAKHVLL